MIQTVQDRGSDQWHDLDVKHVWSLWTRYACTAYYSHPAAWNEIGFSGPAYPRGYKIAGVDKLEPFEVHDAKPSEDPLRGKSWAACAPQRVSLVAARRRQTRQPSAAPRHAPLR